MNLIKSMKLAVATVAIATIASTGAAFATPTTSGLGHTEDSMSWLYKSASGGCESYHPGKAIRGAVGVSLGETKQTATYPNIFHGTGPVTVRGLVTDLPAKAKLKVSLVQQDEDSLCAPGGTKKFGKIKANKHGVARLKSTTRQVNIIASSEQPCITYQVVFQLKGSSVVYSMDPVTHCFTQPLPE